jgi:hypothetical protein
MIYICCRTLNTIYKIDHKTKTIVWSLGEYGDFRLFNKYGQETEIMFFHPHALEKIDLNSFIIFDNDEHNQTDNLHKQSRMLEFSIDTNRMFANVTWDWIAPESYYTGWYGDCDILPNNNRLGVFGTPWHPNTAIGALLTEVDIAGNIVWEMKFNKQDKECFSVYKMERFHFAPIVSPPNLIDLGDNGSLVSWDVWYNFRSKTSFEGEYFVVIDDEVVEKGEINFLKYWKPVEITYHLKETYSDLQEISLVVSDEGGHLSNETDRYTSIGSLSFKKDTRTSLIIGLSVGLVLPIIVASVITLWLRFSPKKRIK